MSLVAVPPHKRAVPDHPIDETLAARWSPYAFVEDRSSPPSCARSSKPPDYADPATVVFDPPLAFDSSVSSERRLTYCARYNNGVAADGSPNPATVRRRSVTPSNGVPCAPVACTHGDVGAACSRDAQCDSTPGAGDGRCDACPITAGVTTEDEMFILIGSYAFGDVE